MTILDQYLALEGKTVSRSELINLGWDALHSGYSFINDKIENLLDKHDNDSFFIEKVSKPGIYDLNKIGYEIGLNSPLIYGLEQLPGGFKDGYSDGLNKPVKPEELYQFITDQVLEIINSGKELPWRKPWKSVQKYGISAANFESKRAYRGINAFLLNFILPWMRGKDWDIPYFLTFKQIEKLGGQLKKGSSGYKVVYFTQLYKYESEAEGLKFGTYNKAKFIKWLKENASKIWLLRDKEWTPEKLAAQSIVPILKYYNVFNADDIDGIDWGLKDKEQEPKSEFEAIETAEAIVNNWSKMPKFQKGKADGAWYMPSKDLLHMPLRETFNGAQEYYSTLFHEMVHATGHPSRLKRDMKGGQGSKNYAFEELIAEMGAVFLCGESGILFYTLNNSAAYLKGWNKRLVDNMKEDNRFFFRASSQAQAAADYILERDKNGTPKYLSQELKRLEKINQALSKASPKTPSQIKLALNSPNKENCHAVMLPIKQLQTDTARFQNRKNAFSEVSARNVAENYDANKFDPVVVWEDPKLKKKIVISGHSRLEGMKRRGAKQIPVRYFKGTEKEAIKFAKVDANRTADKEKLTEDLKAYELLRDGDPKKDIEPVTKQELKEAFPGKVNKLDAYTYLNPAGLFIQVLQQDNLSEYPHIETRAMWVGELAKENPKKWGKLMERNLFYFFYRGDGKGLKLSKADFMDLAQKRLDTLKKGQQVLFPECESDGCKEMQNEFANKLTGDAKKQLHENQELQRFILNRLKTTKKDVKVWTKEEEKYLKEVVLAELKKDAERIKKGIKELEDNQGDLFGMNATIPEFLQAIDNTIASGKKIAEHGKKTFANVMSVGDMLKMKFVKLELPGKWGELLQNVPANFTAMVYGQGKNGKSSFSLQFAKMLSQKGLVLYNFAEQGITATTQDLIRGMGIDEADQIVLSGGRTLNELRDTLKAVKPKFVFIDLMNYYEISPDEMFRFMKEEFPQTAFILVMEATKDGNFKGDNGWLHIVDAKIECKDFVANNSGRLGFGRFVIWPQKVAELEAEKQKQQA